MDDTDRFASTEEPGYLDFAKVGPPTIAVIEEGRALFQTLARARFGSLDSVLDQDERVRVAMAAVTGFRADQHVFQPDTSTGLMQALFGLDGTVLMTPTEFPITPIAAVRARDHLARLSLRWLGGGSIQPFDGAVGAAGPDAGFDRVTPGAIREALDDDVTAVAVSLVDYRTGAVADLEGIRQVIGDRLLIVDAIQGFGVVDAPWQLADVIAAGGQKWMRAGWGTGLLALSDRALETLTPVLSGFSAHWGLELPLDEVPEPPRGAAAFLINTPNPIAQARLAIALEQLAEAGVASVADAVLDRSAHIIALADEFALEVVTPRDDAERAGIVTVRPEPDRLTVLAAALHNHGISATVRGGTVRLSPHTSTTEETFDMLRAALLGYRTALGR